MQHTNVPASRITDPADAGFPKRNRFLTMLPRDVLCGEALVRDRLTELEQSKLPLTERFRVIEDLGLTPFVTGSRVRPEFRLLLELDDNLSRLRMFKIETRIPEETLNGCVDVSGLEKHLLVEVPDPRLLFSANAIYRYAVGDNEREMAAQLFTLGKRITIYRGIACTWDQAVDRNVWTTNIDTVHFINQIAADGAFGRTDVRSVMEIGVGGSAISKTLASKLSGMSELTVTDISAWALMCARRNIAPMLGDGQHMHLYLGKGIRSIEAAADMLIVNPPYIPHIAKPDAVDPYRGTGLIKEILELGLSRLNRSNPDACVYLGMSSLAERDLAEYSAMYPAVRISSIGSRLRVPLKILNVSENAPWLDFLQREHGLINDTHAARQHGFPFWHDIYVLKLQHKS